MKNAWTLTLWSCLLGICPHNPLFPYFLPLIIMYVDLPICLFQFLPPTLPLQSMLFPIPSNLDIYLLFSFSFSFSRSSFNPLSLCQPSIILLPSNRLLRRFHKDLIFTYLRLFMGDLNDSADVIRCLKKELPEL